MAQHKKRRSWANSPLEGSFQNDLRHGFVYERAPHVTLKSIATNAEIDLIFDRYQAKLEPLRAELNAALKTAWENWQIPREAVARWPHAAKKSHAEWWTLRRERQEEIDASIARNADVEYLYDRPYKAKTSCAFPAPSRSRACRRTACCRSAKTRSSLKCLTPRMAKQPLTTRRPFPPPRTISPPSSMKA